jgi:hypothetical protein
MTSTVLTPVDIEAAIVARLTERLKVPGIVKAVYDTKAYGAVEEESQLAPAVAVIYNGYRADDEVGQGTVQAVELNYLVVVVARSSKQTLRATGAKESASEVFDAAVKALIGWQPGKGVRRLRLADADGAGYSDAGFTYLPIGFNTRITYTPQP